MRTATNRFAEWENARRDLAGLALVLALRALAADVLDLFFRGTGQIIHAKGRAGKLPSTDHQEHVNSPKQGNYRTPNGSMPQRNTTYVRKSNETKGTFLAFFFFFFFFFGAA